MTTKPAVTTCKTESCQTEYRLGRETSVYIYKEEPNRSFFSTTCPRCGAPNIVGDFDPHAMLESLRQCNNFSPANPVNIFDDSDLDLWNEEMS